MRTRLARPLAAVALAATLGLTGCTSDESSEESSGPAPTAGSSTTPSPSPVVTSDSPGDTVELLTVLSRNLEAYKKADGKYPKPGSAAYQQVVGIDQADGFTIGYGVDGAGAMTICVSRDGSSASYSSKTGKVSRGGGGGCGS